MNLGGHRTINSAQHLRLKLNTQFSLSVTICIHILAMTATKQAAIQINDPFYISRIPFTFKSSIDKQTAMGGEKRNNIPLRVGCVSNECAVN